MKQFSFLYVVCRDPTNIKKNSSELLLPPPEYPTKFFKYPVGKVGN